MSDDPNAEQREFWRNAEAWVRHQEQLDAQLSHIGLAAMDAARTSADASVLDVGCGCGHTTLQWSERVNGPILGLDISSTLIDAARRRAAEHRAGAAAAGRIRFEVADAQTADIAALAATALAATAFDSTALDAGAFDASGEQGGFTGFDLVFSRFGVMFFADPVAAFANLRAAANPGAGLAFVCWQTPERNPWLVTVNRAVLEVVEMPEGGPSVDPFAFADTGFVANLLSASGWQEAAFEPMETEILFGGGMSLDESVELAMDLGIARRALQGKTPETHAAVTEAIRSVLAANATPAGVVFPAAAWIVTAHN